MATDGYNPKNLTNNHIRALSIALTVGGFFKCGGSTSSRILHRNSIAYQSGSNRQKLHPIRRIWPDEYDEPKLTDEPIAILT